MPNKLSQFWQELKRRKVVRVVIGYLASAYVLLELTSIVAEPLGLPDWTLKLVLVLICIGFIITIIVSWIYDFTAGGIEKTGALNPEEGKETAVKPSGLKLRASNVIIAVLLIAVVVLAYPRVFRHQNWSNTISDKEKYSLAVMPFKNHTRDTLYNNWQEGISHRLISLLSQSDELLVRDLQTMSYVLKSMGQTNIASLVPDIETEVASKLDVHALIAGNILKAGNEIHLDAQLRDVKSGTVLKSFTCEGSREEDIFQMIDSLSGQIITYLEIEILKKEIKVPFYNLSSNSSAAFKFFVKALNYYSVYDLPAAVENLQDAVKIDTNFVSAWLWLSDILCEQSDFEDSKKALQTAQRYNQHMGHSEELLRDYLLAHFEKNPTKQIAVMKKEIRENPYSPKLWDVLGWTYYKMDQFENAIAAYEEEQRLYERMNTIPPNDLVYSNTGSTYFLAGHPKKAMRVYKKGLKDFPDSYSILSGKLSCLLSQGKRKSADKLKDQLYALAKKDGFSESVINRWLGGVYLGGGQLEAAESYLRDAMKLDPEDPRTKRNLADLLIENEINVDEGMDLITELIDSQAGNKTENVLSNRVLARGYYKRGDFDSALKILEEIEAEYPVYDAFYHEILLQIQEVEEAVAKQT